MRTSVAVEARSGTQGATRPKVLFVLGWVRSGTTLLDTMLGQIDGFFSGGEVRYLWERGVINGWMCGCRTPLPACPVWSAVLSRMYGSVDAVPAERVARQHLAVVRTRRLPRVLAQDPGSATSWPELAGYTEALGRLYTAISEVTGARVIVDSSKFAQDAALLRLIPEIDARFVHLVRDPRAVAFSNLRRKTSQPLTTEPVEMARWSAVQTATRWTRFNTAAEAVVRVSRPAPALRLRYEDLIADPPGSLQRVLDVLDETGRKLPLIDDHTVVLGENHTVWGNPARFKRGEVPLRLDDEWLGGLGARDRTVVTTVCLPLLLRYGYPLRPGRDGEEGPGRG